MVLLLQYCYCNIAVQLYYCDMITSTSIILNTTHRMDSDLLEEYVKHSPVYSVSVWGWAQEVSICKYVQFLQQQHFTFINQLNVWL